MIGVIGATGNVGSSLVRELVEAGERVVAVSLKGGESREGLEHAAADITRPETVKHALKGASAVFVLVAVDAHEGFDPKALMSAIRETGAERVVALSSLGAVSRPEAEGYEPLRQLEAAALGSGLVTTILRPTGFASNTFGWIPGIKASRTVSAPFADVAIPIVDPADVAAVAAAALRTREHAGAIYELTGPAAISPRDQARDLGRALGETLSFVELTRAEADAAMKSFLPAPLVSATLDIAGTPNAMERRVSPDIERVLGRAASPYASWAQRNAVAFR